MKKIIVLSIGLLFSSVQAQSLSEAEITQVAEVLAHNAEFVASCNALCKQGLTVEQIVVQLMQSEEARAYVKEGEGEQRMVPWAERSCIDKTVAVLVVLVLIAANIYGTIYPTEYYYEDPY